MKKEQSLKGRKMKITEIVFIGFGLGMDAFAVSVCKGLSMDKMNWRKAIIIASYFATFQMIMPVIGYFLGKGFEEIITTYDHWIIFLMLGIIGINMIKEAFEKETNKQNDDVGIKTMLGLAIATSIDALAVGITFAFLRVNMLMAIDSIGIITFLLCLVGVKIGNTFGDRYKKKAELIGGTILILMGIKILLEHLNIL